MQFSVSKKVIIHVQYGLSNRLRALASAWNIAKATNRELFLIWEPDVHCDCGFDDLFIEHNVNIMPLNSVDSESADLYDYMNGPKRRANLLKINHDTDKDIYIKSAYTLDYSFYDRNSENEFLRSLKPVKEVEFIINSFNVSDMIGLHIRMGAGVNYNNDPWDSSLYLDATGKELMYYWRARSHYNSFIPVVRKILKENPSQKFFLAADMQITYDTFMKLFDNSITFYPRKIYDRSKQQQITALIDMYCLSRTKMIYGSTWSAFTELATRLSDVPFKLSGKDFGEENELV